MVAVKSAKKVAASSEGAELYVSGKLRKLVIQNYRSIGSNPVSIDLDKIVVLVGPNNSGKSSILRAYELIMNDGSKASHLELKDFPNGIADPANPVIIELHTQPSEKTPADKWVLSDDEGAPYVRERWVWSGPGKPTRQGWNKDTGDWDASYPWGPANIAKAMRPQPYCVKAFDTPEEQAAEIANLISAIITERAKAIPMASGETGENGSPRTEYEALMDHLKEFYQKVWGQVQGDVGGIEGRLTEMLSQVFADHIVKFELGSPEGDIRLFSKGGSIKVGRADGYQGPLESQGSGARRTILWAVLKVLSEMQKKEDARPKVLLIDEPELCLHPNAVRDACKVLYDLAEKVGWQVIVTTHSPVFIDLSRDNTTVIRVERNHTGDVMGTTLFRPERAKLEEEDKENLKLLNAYDPYVAEFFFGGKIIVVEGDTEYSAFKFAINSALAGKIEGITEEEKGDLNDVHIIRARGKYNIISICKILNQFGTPYNILHDSDYPKVRTKNGNEKVNPAWTANEQIRRVILQAPDSSKIGVFASLNNFEYAFLGHEVGSDKPYNAVKELAKNKNKLGNIYALLQLLIGSISEPPVGAVKSSMVSEEYFVTPTEGNIREDLFKFDV